MWPTEMQRGGWAASHEGFTLLYRTQNINNIFSSRNPKSQEVWLPMFHDYEVVLNVVCTSRPRSPCRFLGLVSRTVDLSPRIKGENLSFPRKKSLRGDELQEDYTPLLRFFPAFPTTTGLSWGGLMNRRGYPLTSEPKE